MKEQIRFLNVKEKKKLLERLSYYGINNLNLLLVKSGFEKIRGYSGNLTYEEIKELNEITRIELIGLYLFHDYGENDELRLSFDAIHALKSQITKNILEINEKQLSEFMKGREILLSEEDKMKFKDEKLGFKVIKFRDEFIGTGKLAKDRIINYMPKERRLR